MAEHLEQQPRWESVLALEVQEVLVKPLGLQESEAGPVWQEVLVRPLGLQESEAGSVWADSVRRGWHAAQHVLRKKKHVKYILPAFSCLLKNLSRPKGPPDQTILSSPQTVLA